MSQPLTIKLADKTFRDEKHPVQALGELIFDVKAGEFVSILGPTGCGKSTLLRLIVGLDTDFEGQISIGGRLVKGVEKQCGIAFQEPRLLPWLSVRENITFGLYSQNSKVSEKIDELLKWLDLEPVADRYPEKLSGGMAQRVSLARALVNRPELLLLDEPFGALDQSTRRRLQKKTQEVLENANTTVLMVTHDIEEAVYLSDRILLMSKGPGTIEKRYEVTLPTPRKRTTRDFVALQTAILKEMLSNTNITTETEGV